MIEAIRVGYVTESMEQTGDMQISAVISTSTQSRTGLVIHQDGWDFTDYMKNPIVLFNHDSDLPAIGKNSALQVDGERLKAVTEFAPTAFGKELFALYRGGFMRAWSVGIWPKTSQLMRDKKGDVIGNESIQQSLLEYSAVPLPANPDAVNMALTQKLIGRETAALINSFAAYTASDAQADAARKGQPPDSMIANVQTLGYNALRLTAKRTEQLTK